MGRNQIRQGAAGKHEAPLEAGSVPRLLRGGGGAQAPPLWGQQVACQPKGKSFLRISLRSPIPLLGFPCERETAATKF